MRGLERLSAIPLKAGVLMRSRGKPYVKVAGSFAPPNAEAMNLISAHLGGARSFSLDTADGRAFALAKPLPTLSENEQAALLLVYPKSAAMAPYRPMQLAISLIALAGLCAVVYATWRTSALITKPIARLDEAVRRLASGERAEAPVEGDDELARLAASFNHMANEIEEREKRITHLAFNDVLTGLPNRAMFQQQLDHHLRINEGVASSLALYCLDLDHFKAVNDTLGHPVGDTMLVAVAERLKVTAKGCFLARLGGDEFVILQFLAGDPRPIGELGRALIATVSKPLEIDGHRIVPSTSIGVAIAHEDGVDVDTLLRNADLALYRAKEAGRGVVAFFEEALNERAQARRQLENDLRRAIEQGELELYYQPLFDLGRNRIGSFEALLRWNHPERGMISPADFIPVAEDTGLIVPIGAWAMREACREATHWPEHVRIAVNVSSVQFHRPGLNEVILQALAASGLAPNRLEVEITESIFLEGSESTLKVLHGLRELGVRVALDDFGTGYSSLSYLQSFPFDKIKIDRSFIQNLLTRTGAVAVVRAIIDLAGALGMETTAEGVEETEQLSELRNQGCSSVQGFLFSRPVQAADVHVMLGDRTDQVGRRVA